MFKAIVKADIENELNLLEQRISKAKETGYFENKKYVSIIKEIVFRKEVLKHGLQVIDLIKDHLTEKGELLISSSSYISNLFKLKAGHKNEEEMISGAFDKMKEKDATALDDFHNAGDRFTMDYDYSNKLIFQADLIGYISAGLMLFLSYREQIKAINK